MYLKGLKMLKMNHGFKPKFINVASTWRVCLINRPSFMFILSIYLYFNLRRFWWCICVSQLKTRVLPAIFLFSSGVVWYFLYFEQLGVLYMFYWFGYIKHIAINKVPMNILINLIQMLLIFVSQIRPRDCWRNNSVAMTVFIIISLFPRDQWLELFNVGGFPTGMFNNTMLLTIFQGFLFSKIDMTLALILSSPYRVCGHHRVFFSKPLYI